jgi:hypothetical protein
MPPVVVMVDLVVLLLRHDHISRKVSIDNHNGVVTTVLTTESVFPGRLKSGNLPGVG